MVKGKESPGFETLGAEQFNLLLIMVVVSIVFVILGKILLSPGFRKDKAHISGE